MEIALAQHVAPDPGATSTDLAPLPHFLTLQKNCLSETKARTQLIALLRSLKVSEPKTGWESATINFGREVQQSATFHELHQELRSKGVIYRIQHELDRDDSVYGRLLVDASSTPNSNLKLGSSWAGWSREVNGPCRLANVESDLCDDILHYRQQTCDLSNESGFAACCRAYRTYLSSSISIIEAFIGRHVRLADHNGFTSVEFEDLKKTTNLERRIELFWAFSVGTDFRKLTCTTEWNHFQDLRRKRNEILHAADPVGVYALREMQTYLNKVRTGVGGFLLKMREAQQMRTLYFIERLRTAPLIDFHDVTLVRGGPHITRVRQGRDHQ